MGIYTQDNRALAITSPLGKDVLLLERFSGTESISGLFQFQLHLLAEEDAQVKFDAILGQAVTVKITSEEKFAPRFFNGIISSFSQGPRIRGSEGTKFLVRYRADMVPKLWLLTRNVQSRIFQQKSVPDILKEVLAGLDVTYSDIQGEFEQRDYCVQYRESDFDFVSRLMEEEGIFYFFKHSDGEHKLVLANTPSAHPDVPGKATVEFEDVVGYAREEERIFSWTKQQEVRSGKLTLWDFCFEMPDDNLEATQTILDEVKVGTVSHKLKVGGNDALEVYDYPGRYAQRFDGIDPGGSERAADLQKIYQDNSRTVDIRIQEEAVAGLVIDADSDCRLLTSGHKFTLDKHFNGNGPYVVTRVEHKASIQGTYTAGENEGFDYGNVFQCIPAALPYRPARDTPLPRIEGTQTALVVGPASDEIFTDKYGRVKVQFYWDRLGKKDANSSCWIRVATSWAGKTWGAVHLPRIGQEVIIAFEDGDPDRPIIVGCVYNANQMPPYTLPDNKTQSGRKSRSTLQGDQEFFNELRFEDKKDSEDIYFHAQKDFHRVVENDDDLKVGHDQTIEIKNNRTETVKEGNETITIEKGNRTETLKEGDESVTLEKGKRTHAIKTDDTLTVEGNRKITVTQNHSLTVTQGNASETVDTGNISIKATAGQITVEAGQSIELKVGGNSIKIDQAGITLKGIQIKIQGEATVEVQGQASVKVASSGSLQAQGSITQVTGSGMLQLQGGVTMIG